MAYIPPDPWWDESTTAAGQTLGQGRGGRGGRRGVPFLSVDSKVTEGLRTVTSAISGLAGKFKDLTKEAVAYNKQVKEAARQTKELGDTRPTGMRGITGITPKTIGEYELLRRLPEMIGSQMNAMVQMSRVTTRLAVSAGAANPQASAAQYAHILRNVGGFSTTQDLYGGVENLRQLGAIPGARPGGGISGGTDLFKQTGYLARIGGTSYTGASQMIQSLESGPVSNMLRMRGILVSPGGTIRDPIDVLRQATQASGITTLRQAAGARRADTGTHKALASLLGGDESLVKSALDIREAEARAGRKLTDEELAKRFKDFGETVRKQQEAWNKLKDALYQGIIPALTMFANIVRPLTQGVAKLLDKFPVLQKVVGGLILIFGTLIAVSKTLAFVEATRSGKGAIGGLLAKVGGGGEVAAGAEGAAGAGLLSKFGGWIKGLGGAAEEAAPVVEETLLTGALMLGDRVTPHIGDDTAGAPPAATTPSGGPLRGGGNSANLNPDFTGRLQQMFAANPKLSLTSGWRNPQEQAYLYWEHTHGLHPAPVAKPGTSQHEKGLAADIGPPSEYSWLATNAPKFGLKATVGGEPWHWEPTGGLGAVSIPSMAAPTDAKSAAAAAAPDTGGAKTPMPAPVPIMPMVSGGSGEEVNVLAGMLSGGGAAPGGGPLDTGDAVAPTVIYGAPAQSGGGVVHIHNATFTVQIARGTPEEAERTARYLQELMTDRNRMLSIARH